MNILPGFFPSYIYILTPLLKFSHCCQPLNNAFPLGRKERKKNCWSFLSQLDAGAWPRVSYRASLCVADTKKGGWKPSTPLSPTTRRRLGLCGSSAEFSDFNTPFYSLSFLLLPLFFLDGNMSERAPGLVEGSRRHRLISAPPATLKKCVATSTNNQKSEGKKKRRFSGWLDAVRADRNWQGTTAEESFHPWIQRDWRK